MTLTFKDSDGREWELRAHRTDYGDSRFAEPADLLSALGQFSTGSDGPTDARVLRALYAAGAASRQPEVDRLTAENAEYRTQVHQENLLKTDIEAAESELAATKAKLAEVERSRDLHSQERQRLDREERKLLAEIDELTHELASARRVVEAVADAWARYQRNDLSREEFEGFIAERFEPSSPGYTLTSAGTDADRTEPPKCEHQWEPHFSAEMCKLCGRCRSPLAKEPPRPEAGESKPVSRYREEVYLPTEEPKPEPQASGEDENDCGDDSPLPWRVIDDERTATLKRIVDRDGESVARGLDVADARFIVARCNSDLRDSELWNRVNALAEKVADRRSAPERQPEVERDDGSDQG